MEANLKQKLSDSSAQCEAEKALISGFNERMAKVNAHIKKEKVFLSNNFCVEIDGYSENPPIACEAWAHFGKIKPGQRSKIMKDVVKLLLLEANRKKEFRKVIIFADMKVHNYFEFSNSWVSACLREFKFELSYIPLSEELIKRLVKTQEDQGSAFKK
jgi:hypothetical protein